MRILVDLWRFAMVRKKFWLIPVMILAVVYGALAVFTKGSVLAPFIYTIFCRRRASACFAAGPFGKHRSQQDRMSYCRLRSEK